MPALDFWIFVSLQIVACFVALFCVNVIRVGRKKSQPYFIDMLRKPKFISRYSTWLKHALKLASTFFGEKNSMEAFGGCAALCLGYSLFFFLISWLIGGNISITNSLILPEEGISFFSKSVYAVCCLLISIIIAKFSSRYIRYLRIDNLNSYGLKEKTATTIFASFCCFIAVFVATSALFASVYHNFVVSLAGATLVVIVGFGTAITAGLRPNAIKLFGQGFKLTCLSMVISTVITVLGVASAAAVAGNVITETSVGAVFLILIAAGTGTVFALRETEAGFVNAVGVVVGGGAIAVAIVLSDFLAFKVGALTLLLFVFILPFLNAIFDWGTWLASRYYGEKLLIPENRKLRWILGYSAIDLGIALILLVVLTAALSYVVSAFNIVISALHGPEFEFPLTDIVSRVAEDPWGADGLWITLMLITTVVPTVIHITGAFFAVITTGFVSMRRNLAHRLERNPNDEGVIRAVAIYWTMRAPVAFGMTAILWISFLGLVAVTWKPISLIVRDVAIRAML